MASFYDYSVTARNGEEVKMSDFKGKVVMVVNTATGCGFTPQYEPIEQMYRDYHDKGLEILSISQFTLLADTTHGNRPGFTMAEAPDKAKEIVE